MIIISILNFPLFTFLMPILFLWSAIKVVKYHREKKSFRLIPSGYLLFCLISLFIIVLSFAFAVTGLTILTTISSVGLYLLFWVLHEIFKKTNNKKKIITQFVILFISLVLIDAIIIVFIAVNAGLGHSSEEIALSPLRFLLSFIIVVISPIVGLLLYHYNRFSPREKKKQAHIISTGVVVVLIMLIAYVWYLTAGPPIVFAARHGVYSLAKLSLELGADANTIDKYGGYKPLFYTICKNDKKIARLLVEKGAKAGYEEWFFICLYDRLEIAKLILEKGQAPNIWFRERDTNPLILAVSESKADLVKLLLEYGADVHARDINGETALIEAAKFGYLEIVKILVYHGAHVNDATKEGWTPLMWSGENGHVEVVRFLLNAGADKNLKNNQGRTVVEIAERIGQLQVVKILKGEN